MPTCIYICQSSQDLVVEFKCTGIRQILDKVCDNHCKNDNEVHTLLVGQIVVVHSSHSLSLICHASLAQCLDTILLHVPIVYGKLLQAPTMKLNLDLEKVPPLKLTATRAGHCHYS